MLTKIVETKKREVALLKQTFDLGQAQQTIATYGPTKGFVRSLLESPREISVIAEVKKASPSKGLIRPNFDPLEIAQAYIEAKVDCMSVLTDVDYFQGHPDYLQGIRQITNTPLLRKDFIIDPLQVYEARLLGADCILLIAAILDQSKLVELSMVAHALGLDTLVEVHDEEELHHVLDCMEPHLIGINNRNLKTFVTDLQTTERLRPLIPAHIPVVSESGIHSTADIDYLRSCDIRAVLVGEYFMRQTDIAGAVRELVGL